MRVKLEKITGDLYELRSFPRKKATFVSKQKYQYLLERTQRLESKMYKLLEILYESFSDKSSQTKHDRPKTTVLCFFADGKESVYHFHSEPDYRRIKNEMVADGAEMVIVLEEDIPETYCYINSTQYFVFPRSELKTQIEAIHNGISFNREVWHELP